MSEEQALAVEAEAAAGEESAVEAEAAAGDESAAADEAAGDEAAPGDEAAGDEAAAGGESAAADEAAPGEEAAAQEGVEEPPLADEQIEPLVCLLEALLFLSPDPVPLAELAEAVQAEKKDVAVALELLGQELLRGRRGVRLRELGGGYLLASAPEAEEAARRLFSRPRIATLTPAQTETLAIVAYLQPISRPEIGRIRGVSADSATAALLERGLIEEAGRSQFGAALYRTTTGFMKLFGLRALDELPEVSQWDPSPEEQGELRERLLRAGEARAGGGPAGE